MGIDFTIPQDLTSNAVCLIVGKTFCSWYMIISSGNIFTQHAILNIIQKANIILYLHYDLNELFMVQHRMCNLFLQLCLAFLAIFLHAIQFVYAV